MSDLYHVSGYDITLSESGDVGNVTGVEFSQQRVLRRLATNAGAYIFALQYGAGLSGRIGYGDTSTDLVSLITEQLAKEASVAQSPPPEISIVMSKGGRTTIRIVYIASETGQTISVDI